jgi:hypothetical protein
VALGMIALLRRYLSLIVPIYFCLELVFLCLERQLNALKSF